MKKKENAREKRDAEARRRKETLSLSPARDVKGKAPEQSAAGREAVSPRPPAQAAPLPEKTAEEETREFLEYLERHGVPADKEDASRSVKRKSAPPAGIPRLDLEEGMPVVSEAVSRMRLGLQEMKHSQVRVVKLIHGYGSSGKGGKIRIGVREELSALKRRGQIRDFIPGEDFGPMDAASRSLSEREKSVTRDPDYGRLNHGITIVAL